MAAVAADRNLLFGLLALQNGLIDQAQLVAAFHAWARDKARPLADHLADHCGLDGDARAAVEAMVALHLQRHGGDADRSLAAIPAGRSTRESLTALGDPEITATIARVASGPTEPDSDRTASYGAGTASSDGQRFRVLRPHARGGLGVVFVALDEELHREVALKQILDSHADDSASRHRFVVEAEVTGGLEHPGIVPVYGLGTYADGRPYYAMRFIRGDSLKDAIAAFHADEGLRRDAGRRALELHKLLRRFVDVCNAIDYAHARGVLHRDIKPGNVIVGKHGETLVVDWGLAKATGQSGPSAGEGTLMPGSVGGSAETLPGSALGTPAYMSPEQAEGRLDRLGPRSDVYSLGATLYCLLTGRPPFEGDTLDVIGRVRRGDFPPPRRVEPTIDPALEAVCLKAMAREPEGRYPTSKALSEDVDRWVADEPASAWAEPLPRRLRRWGRRHRTAVTAAAAIVVMALAGTAAVLAIQTKANRELKAANRRESRANDALREAVRRERAQFDLAMDAIRDSHVRISGDVLIKQAEFGALRVALLGSARDFFQKLEALLAGKADRRSRAALGRAYFDLGELTAKLGTLEEAVRAHLRAVEVRRGLAAGAGADDEARLELARSLMALATTFGGLTGRDNEVKEAVLEARPLLEAAAKARPDDRRVRVERAQCVFQSNLLLLGEGRPDEKQRIVDSAVAEFRSLAREHPEDREAATGLANALVVSARDARMAGRPGDAVALFRQSRGSLEPYEKSHPDDLEWKLTLASADNDIGVLLGDELERTDEAIAAFERGRNLMAPVVAANPAVEQYRDVLGVLGYNIGRMLATKGRLEEALAVFRRVRDGNEVLAKARPNESAYNYYLWIQNMHIGALLERMGRLPEAASADRRSLEVARAAAAVEPEGPRHRVWIAGSSHNLGRVLERMGRPREAIEALTTARRCYEAAVASFPDGGSVREGFQLKYHHVPTLRNDLASCIADLATARQRSGDHAQAVSLLREAVALLEAAPAPPPADLYDLACYHARLGGLAPAVGPGPGPSGVDGPKEMDLAIGLLRRVRTGVPVSVLARTDPDLAPLRARRDFPMLLMDLGFPSDPFAHGGGARSD